MNFTIRSMAPHEIGQALDWAAAEGWNPGMADAACFHAADPGAFLVATLNDAPIGCISATVYGAAFGFIGFYLMRPEFRGKGYGMALWRAAMARLKGRVIGLDGVVAQQANYQKSGFTLLHRNIRYGAAAPFMPPPPGAQPIEATALNFDQVTAFDRRFFPGPRDAFLREWLTAPGHIALVLLGADGVQALGVLRPCREGSKIGPLFAETPEAARGVFASLLARAPAGPVFLDVPDPNSAAINMAREAGMAPVFETARMYAGPAPDLPLARIYGITSFEMG
ncbi:MAG: GNAT family N-acetyltransferase [Roseomonas sp.]|nr:GNAT family N-acetyltransferase [Roseomonas sp.]MCA3318141.1 GNAT family N-acetyltransferase [Roseomonas sp.]MCA3321609.1 GNAT family N-acetyltransferase [Roseomonas sp.]